MSPPGEVQKKTGGDQGGNYKVRTASGDCVLKYRTIPPLPNNATPAIAEGS